MKLGNPATGDDFRGRQKELQDLWRYIANDHLTLPGARRLGKTSILQRLVQESADKGVYAQWIDVSAVKTASDLLALLNQRFPEKGIAAFVKDRASTVQKWLSRVRKVEAQAPEVLGGGLSIELKDADAPAWTLTAETLRQRLHTQPLLILLDEFPVMLQDLLKHNPTEADLLLKVLRIWRQTGQWCFVFTGSIGLASLLERHGLAVHMNDCFEYRLGPFSERDAGDLWQYFSKERQWDCPTEVAQYAQKRVGWTSPYYLSLLLDQTLHVAEIRVEEGIEDPAASAKVLQNADVDTAYEALLSARSRFHHWEKRLRDALLEPELGVCLALLDHLAKKDDGLTFAQLSQRLSKKIPDVDARKLMLSKLLTQLSDEGYVSPPDAKGRVQFLSFLLRDWWRRNH